jgi:hypothetical protein
MSIVYLLFGLLGLKTLLRYAEESSLEVVAPWEWLALTIVVWLELY